MGQWVQGITFQGFSTKKKKKGSYYFHSFNKKETSSTVFFHFYVCPTLFNLNWSLIPVRIQRKQDVYSLKGFNAHLCKGNYNRSAVIRSEKNIRGYSINTHISNVIVFGHTAKLNWFFSFPYQHIMCSKVNDGLRKYILESGNRVKKKSPIVLNVFERENKGSSLSALLPQSLFLFFCMALNRLGLSSHQNRGKGLLFPSPSTIS